MTNLSVWHKNLSFVYSLTLAVMAMTIFMVYEYFLFSRLKAANYFQKSLNSLGQARSTPIDLLVERTVLYQNGLRFLNRSLKWNSLDSRVNFELAGVFKNFAEDDDLRKSIDISEFGLSGRDKFLFYSFIKSNYILAIAKEPTNMLYHHGLGTIYEVLGDFALAEDEFIKAISLDPQNASTNLYLCKYFYAHSRQKEFEHYLKKVVELQKKELFGGGSSTRMNELVTGFLRSINRQGLIGE